jgi:F0F1-type ATP synthase membrane subunit b/b'
MKRKLLPGLLIALSLSIGVGVTSCKDNDDDLYANLRYEQQTISENLNKKISELQQALATAQANCKAECETARQQLESKLKALIDANTDLINANKELLNGKLDTTTFNAFKSEYENRLSGYEQALQNIAALQTQAHKLDSLQGVLDTKLNKQTTRLDSTVIALGNVESAIKTLETVTNTRIDSVVTVLGTTVQKATEAYELASSNKSTLDIISRKLDSLATEHTNLVDTVYNSITKFNKTISDQQTKIDQLEAESAANLKTAKAYADSVALVATQNANAYTDSKITVLKNAVDSTYNALSTSISTLDKKVDDNYNAVQDQITELSNTLKKYFNEAIDKIVTGVIVQATENPIFGSIAFPMNINSNMLVAFYGQSNKPDFDFPAGTRVNIGYQWTAADLKMISRSSKYEPYTVANGAYLFNPSESDANSALAGKVYLTVNPNTVNFAGTTVDLVNSRDEASGVTLQPLVQSDKLLTFGVGTRAASNGFYEAEAVVPSSQLDGSKLTIDIDKTELKSTVKGILNNRSAQDLTSLVKIVYNAVTGTKIPAYGIKASYSTDGSTTKSTYSNYNIAAVTFKPLSFQFAEGVSLTNLPTIPTFDISKVNIDIKFKLDDIKIPEMTMNGINLDIKLDTISYNEFGSLVIYVKMPKYDENGLPVVVNGQLQYEDTPVEVDNIGEYIANALNSKVDDWNEQIQQGLLAAMQQATDIIRNAINEALLDVSAQINDKIADLSSQIADEIRNSFGSYTNKLNNYISNINSFINRANKFLTDPNHYLQVLMLYQGTDGNYYQGGHTRTEAAKLKLSGGNAVRLFPTTYNAEILVPTFKKFVAVTNVFDNATGKSAQDGDATCVSLLDKANAQDYMNVVIPGERLSVPFYADKAGYTYEIIYSALDYRGVTSTRKFYLQVVK